MQSGAVGTGHWKKVKTVGKHQGINGGLGELQREMKSSCFTRSVGNCSSLFKSDSFNSSFSSSHTSVMLKNKKERN